LRNPKSDNVVHDHNNKSLKSGSIEFNVRGGCVHFRENIYEENLDRIFPDGSTTVFKRLSVFSADESEYAIHDIKVKYVRRTGEDCDSGVIFRFLDFSEEQLDSLERLQKLLPTAYSGNTAVN